MFLKGVDTFLLSVIFLGVTWQKNQWWQGNWILDNNKEQSYIIQSMGVSWRYLSAYDMIHLIAYNSSLLFTLPSSTLPLSKQISCNYCQEQTNSLTRKSPDGWAQCESYTGITLCVQLLTHHRIGNTTRVERVPGSWVAKMTTRRGNMGG